MAIKWGVLGLGKIAHHFCKDLLLVDGCSLHAVGSRSIEKANTFGKQYDASKAYGSYEELLADKEVDIIYIATPHNSHKAYTMQAMEAGKHVLCEKPIAVNYNEVEQIFQSAVENKVFLMEALWSRFNPTIEHALTSIAKGDIGIPTYLSATFSFHNEINMESRLFNPELAGGSILDVGIYPVFLSYVLFGMPNSIAATAKVSEQGVDLQMSAMLEYDNATAQLMSGLLSTCDMVAKVYGTEGKLLINERWHEAESYEIQQADSNTTFKYPKKGRGYTYEIEECNDCINNGQLQSKKWSHQDSLNLIAILDEIRRQTGVVYPFE